MILKVLGGVLIVLSSYLIGLWWANTLKNRVEDIRGFLQALKELQNEISFYSNILSEAFLKISNNANHRISNILKDMSKNLKTKSSNIAWREAMKANYKNTYLESEDINIILSLGNLLGVSDVKGQICNIKNVVAKLQNQEKKAQEIRQKNEALFKNLSILLGATIIILLL